MSSRVGSPIADSLTAPTGSDSQVPVYCARRDQREPRRPGRGARLSVRSLRLRPARLRARAARGVPRRWGARAPREVVMVGMNPGPFGMAQTGVPFGDVAMVRDFVGSPAASAAAARASAPAGRRASTARRSEVSGTRFWGWARDRFGTAERFFDRVFVANWCPLVFMEESGRNRTPDKLPASERAPLFAACDDALVADRRGAAAEARRRRRPLCRAARASGARRRRGNRADPPPEPGEPRGERELGWPRGRGSARARVRAGPMRADRRANGHGTDLLPGLGPRPVSDAVSDTWHGR